MSHWTTVTNGRPISNPREEEKKRKQAEWQARQEEKKMKWIAEYNSEYPRLSDNTPDLPEEYKIEFIRKRNKTRYDDWKARQDRRMQENREKYEHFERIHANECELVLGKKWYSYPWLVGSDYDCELAEVMRYEELLEQHRTDWDAECAQWEHEQKQKKEKQAVSLPDEMEDIDEDDSYDSSVGWYEHTLLLNRLRRQEAELKLKEQRWAEFLALNAKKPPHIVWNATKMKKLLK